MLRITLRTVERMMLRSAMLAALVKSSSREGGLMKATWAAPILLCTLVYAAW